MNQDRREDTTIYKVVMNDEGVYYIWPADRENALGWSDAGKSGPKAECLAYIEEVWTDMRPLSIRDHIEKRMGAHPEEGKQAEEEGKE
ncbi:MAG TPA: MbtH family protein [Pyrinomonadaceae bacterium]|jgi:MbtH protein|nr:MbtH family protein [Pyrinomonadaceae bacterium]